MALQFKTETDLVQEKFEDLLRNCVRCDSPGDKELIEKAFRVANSAHKGMRRKSGEPYILHPISVAKIVTQEIGLGAKSVISALLHDVVEDTDYTIEDIESMFGPKIASIIEGLTKISGVFDKNSTIQAENFRKILLTLSEDVRVILIKLADRLHNMRTLGSMPHHKQMKIAGETIYLYAPMAHRLGLYAIKTELEDLSLKYRHPKIFEEISKKLRHSEKRRQAFINKFSMPIIERLVSGNIKFDISGRPKSAYSIWNKMQLKNVPFEEVFDLFAIRIVFDPLEEIPEKTQCWNIYSMITDIYMPKPDRIRDWVSTPKANGYEALHTTVMGPEGNWVEVQIRSRRMDEIAERGYAAHWKYKDSSTGQENELDKWLKRIRLLLENPNTDALEFLDDFKMNLFASEIIVFTPKGQLRTLPTDSTALDFAYEIHTQVGNKAIGAKINHRLVALTTPIKSGDQIEIITSEQARPKREWLNLAKTMKAKSAIKNALKAETKNRIEKGKNTLEEKLAEINLKPSSRVFKKLLPAYEVSNKDELYSKIGSGIIVLEDLKKILKKNTKNKWIRYWEIQFARSSNKGKKNNNKSATNGKYQDGPVIIEEEKENKDLSYQIAKCCNPIPGDEIIGYKNNNNIVTIHKVRCPNAVKIMSSQAEYTVTTKWTMHKLFSFLIRISISGFDKFGVYNSITTVISKELNVNIRTINLSGHDGIFEGHLDLYVHDTKDLNNLIMNLMKIKGVDSVSRVEAVEE